MLDQEFFFCWFINSGIETIQGILCIFFYTPFCIPLFCGDTKMEWKRKGLCKVLCCPYIHDNGFLSFFKFLWFLAISLCALRTLNMPGIWMAECFWQPAWFLVHNIVLRNQLNYTSPHFLASSAASKIPLTSYGEIVEVRTGEILRERMWSQS